MARGRLRLLGLVALLSAPARAGQTISFGPAVDFPVGDAPRSVAIGDLDGNGLLDLAVAKLNSDQVAVLLGDGNGGFGTAMDFAVGTKPSAIAVGRLDSDAHLDLVTANFDGDGKVSVLLGDGTGSFAAASHFTVSDNPIAVAIGDLNGDTIADLAVASFLLGDEVTILLGNGAGSFALAGHFPAGVEAFSIAIGDLDEDGIPDLAVANAADNDVSILLGAGSGAFGPPLDFPVGNRPIALALGDLDVDGLLDVAVANFVGDSVSILRNGARSFPRFTTQLGTAGVDVMYGIQTVPTGPAAGIYVAGQVAAALPGQSHAGGIDAFVQRYDVAGNLLWTDQFGAMEEGEDDFAYGIASVPSVFGGATVFVAGSTGGTLPGETSQGGRDAFVRAYDPDGNVVFTTQLGTPGADELYGIVTVPTLIGDASIFAVGKTGGDFAGFMNAGGSDALLVGLDSGGNLELVDQWGSGEPDVVYGVASIPTLTGGLTLVVAGSTGGDLPGQTSAGGDDAFVRAYDSTGAATWTRQFGSAADDTAQGAGVTPPGSGPLGIFVGGDTAGALPGQTSAGLTDGFVRRYDLAGDEIWTRQFGTPGNELGILLGNSPAVFLAGGTTGAFPGHTNAGGADAFWAELRRPLGDEGSCPRPQSIDYQGLTAALCSGPFQAVSVFDQEQLDDYLSDFGFDGSRFRDLRVRFNPTGDVVILTPCAIHLEGENDYLDIEAERVCAYGRKGVTVALDLGNPDRGITAASIALVSEEGSAVFFPGLELIGGELSVVAAREARIGLSSTVAVSGPVSLVSTGAGPLADAVVGQGSRVSAGELFLSASREASLGRLTEISVSGPLVLESRDAALLSAAAIRQSALVEAGTIRQTSGNRVVVERNAIVQAEGEVHMDAAKRCLIAGSAVITGDSLTGNCLE